MSIFQNLRMKICNKCLNQLKNIFKNIIWHLFACECHQVVKITVPNGQWQWDCLTNVIGRIHRKLRTRPSFFYFPSYCFFLLHYSTVHPLSSILHQRSISIFSCFWKCLIVLLQFLKCIHSVPVPPKDCLILFYCRRMASDEYASTVLSIMETAYGLGTTMGPFIGQPGPFFPSSYLPIITRLRVPVQTKSSVLLFHHNWHHAKYR